MKKSKYNVSILLPTRGRTEALKRSVMSIINRAIDLKTVQLMLGFDNDDELGIDYFVESIEPWLIEKDVNYQALTFDRMGYIRLNEYVNALASASDADWLMFWNDDAIMETTAWDKHLADCTGEFKLLAVHTHKDHPYSIFPIAPRLWLDTLGYLSPHQISDAWLSQQAYMLNIFKRIEVYVTHDRHDLTGNNKDETFENRPMLEGKPNDPRDFHNPQWIRRRMQDCDVLANEMTKLGIDTKFWEGVKNRTQDPWVELVKNDINKQMMTFQLSMKK